MTSYSVRTQVMAVRGKPPETKEEKRMREKDILEKKYNAGLITKRQYELRKERFP